MAGAASQAGDADSSRAPGPASGLQGSVNVHQGALLLVPQWQCISSFVFYILVKWNIQISLSVQNYRQNTDLNKWSDIVIRLHVIFV